MARRKTWDELSPAYRKRLLSNGITQADHANPKKGIAKARGHRFTPEHGEPRKWYQLAQKEVPSIYTFVPDLDELPADEREQVSKDWIQGFVQSGRGTRLTAAEKRKRGKHPADKKVYRKPSAAQIVSKFDFQQFYVEHTGEEFGSDEWKEYRKAYLSTFSSAA